MDPFFREELQSEQRVMNSVVTRRLLLLLLGLVSGVVAYPAQFYLPDEEQDQGYQTKVVCFVSASNEDYDYANLSPGMCTHFILIDLIGLNAEGRLLLLQRSSRGELGIFDVKYYRFSRSYS